MYGKPTLGSVLFVYALAAVLLLAVVGVSQNKKDQKKVRDLTAAADKSFRDRNYQAAAEGYSEALKLDPQNANAHFWKGAAHVYLKQDDQALSELDAALAQGYTRPLDIYVLRWGINLQKKNYDAALDDVKKGLQIDPNNRDLRLALADISYGRGNFQEAVAAYESALPSATNRGDIYFRVASAYDKIGDSQRSIEAAENAIKNGTRFSGDSYVLIAAGYRKLRKWDEAADAYQRAIAAKPESYELYREVAELYRSQGRFTDAITVTRRGLSELNKKIGELQKDPAAAEQVAALKRTAAEMYTDNSWYFSLADKYDDAVNAALAGIQLAPDLPMGHTNLCRAYNDQGKFLMAISACTSALKLSPDDGETYFYLGRAYSQTGKPAEAAKAYNRAVTGMEAFVRENADYSDGFYILGNAYYATDQLDKAIGAYTKCLELSPRFVKARYNLGVIQVVKKNKAAAMEQYNSLVSLDAGLAAKLKTQIDKL